MAPGLLQIFQPSCCPDPIYPAWLWLLFLLEFCFYRVSGRISFLLFYPYVGNPPLTFLRVVSCLELRDYREGGLYTCIYGLSFFLPVSRFAQGRRQDLRTAE